MGYYERMAPKAAQKSLADKIFGAEPQDAQKAEDTFAGAIFGTTQKTQAPAAVVPAAPVAKTAPTAPVATFRPMGGPKQIANPEDYQSMAVTKSDGSTTRQLVRVIKAASPQHQDHAMLAVDGYLTLTKLEKEA